VHTGLPSSKIRSPATNQPTRTLPTQNVEEPQNTLDQIVRALTARFERADVRPDVEELLAELARRGLVLDGGA
jgi:hypothetical protein